MICKGTSDVVNALETVPFTQEQVDAEWYLYKLLERHIMCIYLKVKLRSLAAESRIIRNEERKQPDNYTREQLYLHRIHDVREEARATHIAYAFLRKVPFKVIEHPVHSPRHLSKHNPIKWDRVYRMVSKYAHWDIDMAKSEVLKWAYIA